jgi:hypothetical protein
MNRAFVLGLLPALLLAAPSQAAEPANVLGVFQNWKAFSTGSGDSLTCFAMSEPRASQPKTPKRANVYLMVSDWPGRKIKGEPEIAVGTSFKAGAAVTLGVGEERFDFFSRNDGKVGTAWLKNLPDGPKLTDALSGGVSAVARGTSAKGQKLVDTYSLAGFPEAMAKVHAACNMS